MSAYSVINYPLPRVNEEVFSREYIKQFSFQYVDRPPRPTYPWDQLRDGRGKPQCCQGNSFCCAHTPVHISSQFMRQ